VAVVDRLPAGLYEVIVTKAVEAALTNVDGELIKRQSLRSAEAADRIAQLTRPAG
jgi:hypothetical protein